MSKILKETREEAQDLYRIGLISEKEYDNLMRLTARKVKISAPKSYTAQQIKAVREQLNCSQAVLADILCVTADTISKWERGERDPKKQACRLLQIIEKEGLEAIC